MSSGSLPVVQPEEADAGTGVGAPAPSGAARPEVPSVALEHLDTLWFQVTGTICNLRCEHCFISCAPDNHTLEFLELETVLEWVERSGEWGVKEYYITGGEPFMHRDLPEMIEAMLERGPVSVLTNGTLLREKELARLRSAERDSLYSLEIRVSIDGPSPETNDPIRGEGTFERAMDGVRSLLDHGFLPIITATQVWEPSEDERVRREFVEVLREVGYENPRIKILPSLKIGREAARTRGYGESERVTMEMMEGYDQGQLLCSSSRIVTAEGVHVCPILVDRPDSLMGQDLDDADRPFALSHDACYTCWLHGAICTNYAGIGEEVS
jgi:molybdenum cofactor biosynthesis enzyme MoaA